MINTLFWEFVQNLALTVPALLAVRLWAGQRHPIALTVAVVGGALGSGLIYVTEPFITGVPSGRLNPIGVAVFSLCTVALTVYLGSRASWANWKTDIALGLCLAVAMAVGQAAASWPVSVPAYLLHGAAMFVAISPSLVLMRTWQPVGMAAFGAQSLLVAALVTVVMVVNYV